jgi:hypothetical protein
MTKENFEKYIESISGKFSHYETSEIGYRTDFEVLLQSIFSQLNVRNLRINHDAKAQDGNKPDFAVMKNNIPILYIEAKDIGISLDKVEKSEQMARYFGYANLVLTDYVEFRFYRNGIRYEEPIKIANYDIKSRMVEVIPQNFEHLSKSLLDFAQSHKEPIKSGVHLSKIMGGKAQRIRDNVKQFLLNDSGNNEDILKVYETIKRLLVHDLTKESFADMYAQTLVYGLFVARFYDETPDSFSRVEARDLIPNSNPFLRHFFDHIVGPDFDKRLEYIVDELCEVFSHADIPLLMKQYFKNDLWDNVHEGPDPVIHFYEDFLREYDSELRKKMGAFYTPLPVVRFIIRAVDQILEKDFNLASGLANTSKLSDGKHKVQILDPATGTGTFISAAIANIYARFLKNGQKGRWPSYVQNDLLPRLHGFELMMAPYTIAHLKLSMAFEKTGFKYFNQKRLGIYLTNSLEETPLQQDLFAGFGLAESIAEESKEASKIKNDTPIMVVVGNPPYSGHSSNKGMFEKELIEYKKESDGSSLKERNPKWLNDDYVKFIRFGELMVEKNSEGILAFITNHGYLDNPTFRGMRHHLLQTFDSIYIVDLHGNSKKKEVAPDGSKDENVFDIQQGVAIMIAIKTGKKKQGDLAALYKQDIFGKRENKFEKLDSLDLDKKNYEEIEPSEPSFLFKSMDMSLEKEYKDGFSTANLFLQNSVGIVTAKDAVFIADNRDSLEAQINAFFETNKIIKSVESEKIQKISYRPFDSKFVYYDVSLLERAREKVMKNFQKDNIGLISVRQVAEDQGFNHIFVSDSIVESRMTLSNKGICYVYPMYLYDNNSVKTSNLNQEIVDQIEQTVGKTTPEDIFDYIYASLHSPSYREKYKEFLKIDFPRVPFPQDAGQFKKLVAKGKELQELHLMESPLLNKHAISYPEEGNDVIEKIDFRDGRVYINASQYFGNVPEIAWNFYIGGYQPAQKWLKDRKDRVLANENIEHYQKIIIGLIETNRIMKEIDKIN